MAITVTIMDTTTITTTPCTTKRTQHSSHSLTL